MNRYVLARGRVRAIWGLAMMLLWVGGCQQTQGGGWDGVPLDVRAEARRIIDSSLTHRSEIVRAHAVEAVKDTVGSSGHEQIIAAMSDPAPVVRFAACMAAGELRLPQAVPVLRKMMGEPNINSDVQVAVIFALHRLGDVRYSAGLEEALGSTRAGTRGNAVLALGRLGEPTAVRVIRPRLKDSDVGVRLQAAEALWRLGDEEGLKALASAALSGNPSHQMTALLALAGPRRREVIQHVRESLESDRLEVRLVAARAMGMLGSREGLAIARGATTHPEAAMRYLSALALGAIGDPDTLPLLRRMLSDSDADVRLAAAVAVFALDRGSPVAGGIPPS